MDTPIVRVAHRGASAECPENTLLAYQRAMEHGVDALEIDVHLTADGHLVVIHDASLERTTSGQGRVAEKTLAEIEQLDAGGGQHVPTLAEVIALVRATPVRLCVEIKGDTELEGLSIAEAIVRFLQAEGFLGQAMLTSFSAPALLRAKALEPALPTMLDPSPQDGSLTPRQICEQTLRAGANSLSFDFEHVNTAVVDEARRTGLALWPWAPCEPGDIRRMLDLGVPGLMTDRPDTLNQVLRGPQP